MDCVLDGAPCRALIDTGSTISLVRPGILPGTLTARPPGWEATKLRITTVTGERADLNGRKVVRVRINQVTTHHQFWLANIQDECILGLDLLEKWGAMVDVSQAQLHLGADTVSLQATGNASQARQGFATSPTQAAPLVQEHRASTPARKHRLTSSVFSRTLKPHPQRPRPRAHITASRHRVEAHHPPPRRNKPYRRCVCAAVKGWMNVSAARYETYSTGMPTFSLLGMRIVPARVWCNMKSTPEMPAQFDFVPAGCRSLREL